MRILFPRKIIRTKLQNCAFPSGRAQSSRVHRNWNTVDRYIAGGRLRGPKRGFSIFNDEDGNGYVPQRIDDALRDNASARANLQFRKKRRRNLRYRNRYRGI